MSSAKKTSFQYFAKKSRDYGMGEFLEIMGELSQESIKKGEMDRITKEFVTLGIALHKNCSRCVAIHGNAVVKLGASDKEIEQVYKISLFMKSSPEEGNKKSWNAWKNAWKEFSLARGPLNHHQRECIALAIALVMQHKKQIKLHLKGALCCEGSKTEVFEVFPVALLMDGAPVLSQLPYLVELMEGE